MHTPGKSVCENLALNHEDCVSFMPRVTICPISLIGEITDRRTKCSLVVTSDHHQCQHTRLPFKATSSKWQVRVSTSTQGSRLAYRESKNVASMCGPAFSDMSILFKCNDTMSNLLPGIQTEPHTSTPGNHSAHMQTNKLMSHELETI